MKSIETRIIRGPNQWSDDLNQLIVMKVACGESELDDKIKIVEDNPQKKATQGSADHPGMMTQLMLLISQLQSSVSTSSEPSSYRAAGSTGEYFVIVPYDNERVGLQICRSAVLLLNEWLNAQPVKMEEELAFIRRIRKRSAIGPTSNYILDEVKRRNIPYYRFEFGSLMILGYGLRQKKIRTAVTDETSGLGIEMAGDKEETKHILMEANCPVPGGIVVDSEEELEERLHEVEFPVVIKPLDGNHGRGVTTQVMSLDAARTAFQQASAISDSVIVEQFISGHDYRFLVVDFKLVAVARRLPACITGNGLDSIKDLIERENLHKDRGDEVEHVLAKIKVDTSTEKILRQNNYTLDTVLAYGQVLVLKDTANISAGGTAEDVTDEVHPYNRLLSERIARLFNLNICGVDIVAGDVSKPLGPFNGAVIEVNAGPGLRMHSNPQAGKARNIAGPIVDMLFKNREEALIPVVAVTGTNGKTTTTRLIAHLADAAGKKAGYCCSDGIYSNGWKLRAGDCTGSASARNVLHDPMVDFAILETARGGIIRTGLGFTTCDVAVVTNISEDHLGLRDIETLEQLADIKSVIVRCVSENGYAVLNAEDDLVFSMKKKLRGKCALFSLTANHPRLQEHLANNGLAAFTKNGRLFLSDKAIVDLGSVSDFPLSFDGKADFMIRNILAASLAAYCSGIAVEVIRQGLMSFSPNEASTPGRMNHYQIKQADLYLDYAHNVDGFKSVADFISKQNAVRKLAVIAIAGDRRETDIVEVGRLAAKTFDEVILRYNKKERGIGNQRVCELLEKGYRQAGGKNKLTLIAKEEEALKMAIDQSSQGDLIFACADHVESSLAIMEKLKLQYGK